MLSRILKILFFALIVKPVVFVVLGLNIRGRDNLPKTGPAVLIANHNSHLDTMVMMSLYPLSKIHKVRPVAAADYFMESGGIRAWFSKNCIGIIPMDRSGSTEKEHLFDGCNQALDKEDILILFPEGSRGEPEQMSSLKKGVYHLLSARQDTQATPIMLHGLGKALPKGEALLVPFNCDVIVGPPLSAGDNADGFVEEMGQTFEQLGEYCLTMETKE
ncbi:MAG: 1-acyl-sn-glycerol-3-phosphate acyltransferase [Acidiferrobacterales bacterium]|nr:1-acyl-sn-glycerol-3-phosphate acyltransferase [Acidiferrobacterales bacterium]